jgi:hypothetical protein
MAKNSGTNKPTATEETKSDKDRVAQSSGATNEEGQLDSAGLGPVEKNNQKIGAEPGNPFQVRSAATLTTRAAAWTRKSRLTWPTRIGSATG